ncbi:MAG: SDR family oxidoreductase [Burkholderiaceae bacterium]
MNKVIITGHSKGLGAALTEAVLERGDHVLAISRSGHEALAGHDRLTEQLLDLSDSQVVCDWLETGSLAAFLAGAKRAVLINNAGVVEPIGPPGVQGASNIALAVSLNVSAPLMFCDAFVRITAGAAMPDLTDRRVVHISSGAARNAYAGWSVYCATKAALDHHARAVVADNIANLSIESLAPGVIDTQMQAQIRATSTDRFPAKERFEAMKRDGALASAQASAQVIVKHLYSNQFGQETASDVRQFS